MAAARTKNLLFALCACFCTFVYCEDTLYITHSPSYVTFQKDAGPIDVSEVPDVLSLALGFSSSKNIKWNGLSVGDIFRRPKANILITIETADNALSLDVGRSHADYPLQGNGGINLQALRDSISAIYGDDRPLLLELTPGLEGLQVSTEYQSTFKHLPDTLSGILPLLRGDGSIVAESQLGRLNLTSPTDVALLSELQLLREVVNKLRENPSGVTDSIPDVYVFGLSGLRVIESKYGAASPHAQDAARLLASFLSQFSTEMANLYGGDALVEVVTSQEEPFVNRRSRSLLQDVKATTPPPGQPKIENKAPAYDQDYPVIFNIILWMGILFALSIFVIAYALWYLDPGDTIIYRMTSQRIKID